MSTLPLFAELVRVERVMAPASLAALETLIDKRLLLRLSVLRWLCQMTEREGWDDVTASELAERAQLSLWNVRPRLHELHRMGIVSRTTGYRKPRTGITTAAAHGYFTDVPLAAVERAIREAKKKATQD